LIGGDAISISLSKNISSIFSKGRWLLCKLKVLLAQNTKKASLSHFPKLHPYEIKIKIKKAPYFF